METVVPLLGPSVPALGMRSAQDPSTLPSGLWSRLENLRSDRGTLRVRNGSVEAVAEGIPGAHGCKGTYSATLDGATFQLGAFRIPVPTAEVLNVTDATYATPISIVTSVAHGLETGGYVTVAGVGGNTNANGLWTVTVTASNAFTLDDSVGNAVYTSGGTATVMASRTGVFRLSPGGDSWTELTNEATRFVGGGEVGFASVRDPGVPNGVMAARDVLVFGVSGEAPRVAYHLVGTFSVGIHTAPPAPSWVTASALPSGWMELEEYRSTFSFEDVFAYKVDDNTSSHRLPRFTSEPAAVDGNKAAMLFRKQWTSDGSVGFDGLTLQKEVVILSATSRGATFWDYSRQFEVLINPESPNPKTITSVSNTTPIVVTCAGHGFSNGDCVRVVNVGGSTTANGTWRVENVTTNTFELEKSSAGGVGTGGTATELEWVTLWDLNSSTDTLNVESLGAASGTGKANAAAVLCSSYEGRTGWSGIRFTASGGGSYYDYPVYTVATSGQIDGRSLFAVSYYGRTSRAEGVALEAERKPGTSLSAFGGAYSARHFRWEPTSFRTDYRLMFPGSDDLAGNPDYALIYRSDPYLGEDGTTLFGDFLFSGNHVLPSSEPLGGNVKILSSTASDDVTRTAPEVGVRSIPPGNLFLAVNDRLWVAGTSTPTELWVSADRNPFSFRQVPLTGEGGTIVATSATYRTFGNEKVTALYPLHGEILAVDSVALWTDRGMYRLGGFSAGTMLQAARLSEWGTLRARTVTAYGGTLWYLDTEASVRQSNGGLASDSMTIGRVDDILRTAELGQACAVAGYESYRLFLREAGNPGQTSCLVWQSQVGEWTLDVFPFAIEGCNVHYSAPLSRLYAAEASGKLWYLDVPGQESDGSTPIEVRMEGPELSNGLWAPVTFGAMGIVVDGEVDTTLETRRWVPYTGMSFDGTVNLQAGQLSTASAWRWDSLGAGTEICFSCIPSLRGEMPGGRRIRALMIKMNAIKAGGADRV